MRRLSAVLLLALWLPATSHCALETAGMLSAADGCCAEDDADHCVQDSCAEVEDNLVKAGSNSELVKAPVLACVYVLCSSDLFALVANGLVGALPADGPPAWLPAWSFTHRTALPARAPSIA